MYVKTSLSIYIFEVSVLVCEVLPKSNFDQKVTRKRFRLF